MRRAASAVVVIAALALALGGIASAHTKKFPTTVTIALQGSPTGDSFAGQVKSSLKKCKQNRKVLVYRQGALVGQTKSDETGAWVLSLGGSFASPGKYTAVALRKKYVKPGQKHICLKGTSPEFKITGGGGP
ncbi:MAG: hypothetical protein AABM43_09740 [Actinomycetota bacterium]